METLPHCVIPVFTKDYEICFFTMGTGWSSWLRHSATSRKIAGSFPD